VSIKGLSKNITKKKYNRSSHPKVNWGRGRLSKYESFTGFAAKFCRLNNLSPRQFNEFWHNILRCFRFDEKQLINKHIARILDEPLPVVKTVFLDSGLGWGFLSIGHEDNNIRYCPSCVIDGYHGYFHESPWLKKCPIHCVDITVERFSPGVTKFDQFVNRLSALFDQYCPGWETSKGKYLDKNTIKKRSNFYIFLSWHYAVQKSTTEWSDACLEFFGYNKLESQISRRFDLQQLDLLLGRLNWISPIPKQLSKLFLAPPLYVKPNVQVFGQKLNDEINNIVLKCDLNRLIYLYKLANFVSGDWLPHQKIAESAINALNFQHDKENCMHTWGHCNDGWDRFKEGVHQEFCWSYECPYEFAMSELQHAWIDLIPITTMRHISKLDHYELMANEISKTEIVSIVDRASGETRFGTYINTRPILKFNWSEEMSILIETILSKVVEAHIDELNCWLLSVESGNSPYIRNCFPPSVYLVHPNNSQLQLVSWPTEEKL
jgi:hypothetical protein